MPSRHLFYLGMTTVHTAGRDGRLIINLSLRDYITPSLRQLHALVTHPGSDFL